MSSDPRDSPLMAKSLVGLAPSWGAFIFRGILWLIFGLCCLVTPNTLNLALIKVFGAFTILDGLTNLFKAWNHRRANVDGDLGYLPPSLYVLAGICGIAIGIAALVNPQVVNDIQFALFGAFFVITGLLEIILSILMCMDGASQGGEWFVSLSGILSLFYGIVAIRQPDVAILPFTLYLGVVTMTIGLVSICLGARLRTLNKVLQSSGGAGDGPEGERETGPLNIT